ncbi:MAG: hypothetical protein GY716_17280, partial [bacterium]|nr:hypothetical protein [bacterium]
MIGQHESPIRRVAAGLACLCVAWAAGCHGPHARPQSAPGTGDGSDASGLLQYWQSHAAAPLDYLVQKFEDERWVIVGEYHRVRHDVELIGSLVPR